MTIKNEANAFKINLANKLKQLKVVIGLNKEIKIEDASKHTTFNQTFNITGPVSYELIKDLLSKEADAIEASGDAQFEHLATINAPDALSRLTSALTSATITTNVDYISGKKSKPELITDIRKALKNESIDKSPITKDSIEKITIKDLFNIISRLSIDAVIWIVIGIIGLLSITYKLGYDKGISKFPNNTQTVSIEALNGQQKELLKEIWKYQKTNNLNKVIINRNGFIFDDSKRQNTDINLADKTIGGRGQQEFERLVLSMPEYFLKHIPETRLDSPYVVTIPNEMRNILDKEL